MFEFSRSSFGGLLGPSGTIFTSIFTPIFRQISHNFHTLSGEAIWSLSGHALGEASPAARHCALHGYLDRFCSPPGARLAKMREVPRIMRHPAHSHRIHSVCVAIYCRMVPLTWWLHPGPAPRCHMVSDSVRDTRNLDFLWLPKRAPEVSGKCFLPSPF